MKWLTRPSTLATAAALLVGAAAVFVLLPGQPDDKPNPPPVAGGAREIAWLYYATGASAWQRFVEALEKAKARLDETRPDLGLALNVQRAYPEETADVPEVVLSAAGGESLVFRWYKLKSTWKTRDWVEALLKKGRPPPLAVIGGSNSDLARELADQLRKKTADFPESEWPLLLLTTATADRVTRPDPPHDFAGLTELYKDRTFRFCFSNKQMARAVTEFLWSQDDLRPNPDAVYLVEWDDDAYSDDLYEGFRAAPLLHAGLGFPPWHILSSVGTFHAPNAYEADAVEQLVAELERGDRNRRPLLIVTGQTAPCRRFLRALERTDPGLAGRLVVATGDAVSFNTVYRDRRVTWSIQDLPFPFVFFSHYNPVSAEADFRPEPEPGAPEDDKRGLATGSEDLLLNRDLVEALVQAATRGGFAADAAALRERLAEVRQKNGRVGNEPDGRPFFEANGDRAGGFGEHIVWLKPHIEADHVWPEAKVQVWGRCEGAAPQTPWCVRRELDVSYGPPRVKER